MASVIKLLPRIPTQITLFRKNLQSVNYILNAAKHSTTLLTARRNLSTNKDNSTDEKSKETFLDKCFPFLKNSKWKVYPEFFLIKNLRPDKVLPTYKMIYRSELETYANLAMLAAGTISVTSPLALFSVLMREELTGFRLAELSIFCLGTVLTVASIYFISTKVPLRIYYSEKSDDFLVYTPSLIPYRTQKLVVKPGELLAPTETSQYLPWVSLQHIHLPSKKKLLLHGEKFTTPMYYNKLLR